MNDVAYPVTLPSPPRLADGSVLTQQGLLLPFAASCPPETTPDPATTTCVPYPGARNINYECGGVLVPPGAPGCDIAMPRRASAFEIEDLTFSGVSPAWPGCLCSTYNPSDEGAGVDSGSAFSSPGSRNFDSKFACFLLAVAVIAAFTRK